MEQRKLIKLGNSSFAIALPKDWINKSGLKKGDDIFVEHNSNGELNISSEFKKINGDNLIEINLDNKDLNELWKEASSAYIRGFNLINFTNKKDKENVDSIKEVIKSLMGLEIVENNKENVIVKDFFNIEEINPNNFLRRMDNNLKEMFATIMACFDKESISNSDLSDIEDADSDINRFYLVSSRILHQGLENPSLINKLKTSSIQLVHDWLVSFNLEHIGDEIKSIAKIFKNANLADKNIKEIKDLMGKVRNIYNNSIESVYNGNKNFAINTSIDGKKVWEECEALAKSKNPDVAKIAIKLKEIEAASYQNTKMVAYLRG